MRPFVAGQKIQVRVSRNGKRVKTRRMTLRPGPNGTGVFQLSLSSAKAGRIAVIALHKPTPQLERLRSRAVRVRVLFPSAPPGASGAVVRLLQRGLARLHYAVPRSGVYDPATQRAVMAWRKMTGNARNYVASASVIRGVLAGRGRFHVRHPDEGHHVEADLSRQVMALIDGGRSRRIYRDQLWQAVDADGARALQGLSQGPGTNGLGMVVLELLHRRLRDPRLHRGAGLPRATAACGSRAGRPVLSLAAVIGDVVCVYP